MTEPAGVERLHRGLQVLTVTQRAMLAQGIVPSPTESQWLEMREFARQCGLGPGVEFAWIMAARLLIDHYDVELAALRCRLADAEQRRAPWWRRLRARWSWARW